MQVYTLNLQVYRPKTSSSAVSAPLLPSFKGDANRGVDASDDSNKDCTKPYQGCAGLSPTFGQVK